MIVKFKKVYTFSSFYGNIESFYFAIPILLMKFPQLCYQFKDLLADLVAEFEFAKNQEKPCKRHVPI